MDSAAAWLPPMLSMDGVWEEVLAGLYQVFEADFEVGRPTFEGRAVWWDRRILPGDRYEEGFWHLISQTDRTTGDRIPDYRRAERLPWCAPSIRHSQDPVLKVWDFEEGSGRVRTYLWLETLDYVVILQKQQRRRRDIAFLVTAFHVDGPSRRRALMRKYAQRRS